MAECEDKDSTDGEPTFSTPEEELLFYARNGADINIQKLLQQCKYNNLSLNINCKGFNIFHFYEFYLLGLFICFLLYIRMFPQITQYMTHFISYKERVH